MSAETTTTRGLLILALGVLQLATQTVPLAHAADRDDLNVLGTVERPLVYDHLLGVVERQAAQRNEAVKLALKSPQALAARREQLRAHLRTMVGALPARTPLNARTLGTIVCDGYRIEKVIFESRPHHHVTANLYLPDAPAPVPGVLVPCGHSDIAKAEPKYQSACVLLALNRIAALIYDPIGQGERFQIADLKQHGTNEHTRVGIGALAVGLNTAHFRIWDGVRALDYLAGRPEVDPERLGCTGNSGGGTMTTWLMAVDDRIKVAAPSCFITTIERLFKTIGPQDCEQHFPNQGLYGIDHTDFITMRAPRPTLILAAEKDFFDFQGTREAYEQARAVYQVLAKPQQVGLFSFNDEHGFSQPRREAASRWMRRWLVDDDRTVWEPAHTLQSVEELRITKSGQVIQEFPDEVTVVDLVRSRARALAERRQPVWDRLDQPQRQAMIRRTLGLQETSPQAASIKRLGTIDRGGYHIEKLVLRRADNVPLPALLCVGDGELVAKELVLYFDDRGKAAALQPGGRIEQLVQAGRAVLSVDLRGYGETADQKAGPKYGNPEFRTSMVAMHVGRPLLSERVEDLLAVLGALSGDPRFQGFGVHVVAVGRAGPVALHAAALDARIKSVELHGSIGSWEEDVVARPLTEGLMGHVVPGALEHYDLSDLAAMLGERLIVADPKPSAD